MSSDLPPERTGVMLAVVSRGSLRLHGRSDDQPEHCADDQPEGDGEAAAEQQREHDPNRRARRQADTRRRIHAAPG
jgi:hypothetical protein